LRAELFEAAKKTVLPLREQQKPYLSKPSREQAIYGTAEQAAENLGFVSGHDFKVGP
jgi:hypothetical protein